MAVLFNKNRKDGLYPVEVTSDMSGYHVEVINPDDLGLPYQKLPLKIRFPKEKLNGNIHKKFLVQLQQSDSNQYIYWANDFEAEYMEGTDSTVAVKVKEQVETRSALSEALAENGAYMEEHQATFLDNTIHLGHYPFLIGPKGCGKSTIARAYAKAKGFDFYEFDMGQALKPKKFFIGGMVLKDNHTEVVQSEFLKAFTSDKPTLIFMDELTRIPDQSANYLMTILAKNQSFIYNEDTGERIMKGKQVFFIAAGNMGSQYLSTTALDSAFEDRFVKILIDYPDQALEEKIILKEYSVNRKDLSNLLKIAQVLRNAEKSGDLQQSFSSRQVKIAASYLSLGYSLKDIVNKVILNNYISTESVDVARSLIASVSL